MIFYSSLGTIGNAKKPMAASRSRAGKKVAFFSGPC
jgi:hypothetical protein